jgi:hypothetical protein
MSSRSSGPARRPVAIALCLMAACLAVAVLAAASAHAAEYKMVNCAAISGAPPYTISSNTGIFTFENDCISQGGDPPGNASFLRISEHESGGNAAYGAYLSFNFETPSGINFRSAGGYTREPNAFNDGWQARFGFNYMNGNPQLQMVQGSGLNGAGQGYFGTTSTFASHLWPWGYPIDFYRWTFQLICARTAGCDRANYNAVDLNGIVFTLRDWQDSKVEWTNSNSDLMRGRWVRGPQTVTWQASDQGSGLRIDRLRLDGAERYSIDHQSQCDTSSDQTNGTYARVFQPCPTGGPWGRSYTIDPGISDGTHTVQACAQDFAQWQGLNGTAGESCDQRTIRTDNHAPGKPAALAIRTLNPNRYQDHFGATFSLPPDPGSPIRKVHYKVLNGAGEAVEPEKTLTGTNPSEVKEIEGPAEPGAYRLKLWLEDEVGFTGQAAEVAIPHDSTPPAAPQGLRVTGPSTARWSKALDVRWADLADNGSPVNAAHYEFVDGAGNRVGDAHTVHGTDLEALQGIATPAQRGKYDLRVWLSDEEGNVGAAASVPVPIDETPPAAPQGLTVTPPDLARGAGGFDVRWYDLQDSGSPIVAARYEVLDSSGKVAVPTQTVQGNDIEAISDLEAPRRSGPYALRLWLEDEEGNAGAPVTAPLAYRCVRSEASGASAVTAGLGESAKAAQVVKQGTGSVLRGRVSGPGGGVAGASVCVFARVVTDLGRELLGFAVSGPDGGYRFALGAGPSREVEARYRSGHREASARAELDTRVRPTLKARSVVVADKHYARFFGRLPGPDNDRVVVVLQVKQGKGWRVFRRYRTRSDGRYRLLYRFGRTASPATYLMRAQVRRQAGYPYLPGNSRRLRLHVVR